MPPSLETFFKTLRNRSGQPDFLFAVFLFAVTAFAFFPITLWLAESTIQRDRLLNAFFVLLTGGAMIVLGRERKPEEYPLAFGTPALYTLVAAYLLLVTASVAHIPHLVAPAYSLVAASFSLFVFGRPAARITAAIVGTFCAFIYASMAMEMLDWPLRVMAGEWSAWILSLLGKDVELGVVPQGDLPHLILLVDSHPFHVASECNGFGVLTSSLLIALLLSIYRKLAIIDVGLNLFAAFVTGFAFNILRIVVIVLLAPAASDHYHFMHETVGLITFWSCLVFLWWLLYPKSTPLPTENEV